MILFLFSVLLLSSNVLTLLFNKITDINKLTKEERENITVTIREALLSHMKVYDPSKVRNFADILKQENPTDLSEIFSFQDIEEERKIIGVISSEDIEDRNKNEVFDMKYFQEDMDRAQVEADNRFRLKAPQFQRQSIVYKQLSGIGSSIGDTVVNLWKALTNPRAFLVGLRTLLSNPVDVIKLWRQREANTTRIHGINYQIGRYFWSFIQIAGSQGLEYASSLGTHISSTASRLAQINEVAGYASTVADLSELGQYVSGVHQRRFESELDVLEYGNETLTEEQKQAVQLNDYKELSVSQYKMKYGKLQ